MERMLTTEEVAELLRNRCSNRKTTGNAWRIDRISYSR